MIEYVFSIINSTQLNVKAFLKLLLLNQRGHYLCASSKRDS